MIKNITLLLSLLTIKTSIFVINTSALKACDNDSILVECNGKQQGSVRLRIYKKIKQRNSWDNGDEEKVYSDV